MSKQTSDIEACAARWILQRDRGEFNSAEREELEAWLSADARHREAYLQFDAAWRASAALKNWRPADGSIDPDVLVLARTERRSRFTKLSALATSLLLVVASCLIVLHRYSQTDTYVTEVGGYQRVLLDDGSVIQLNTDSRLKVRYAEDRREVRLLRGEAHFKVARDEHRPFEVITEDAVVRAVGTAFNVHRQPAGTRVAVTEGKVSLSARAAGNKTTMLGAENPPTPDYAPAIAAGATRMGLMLTAGDIADATATGVNIERAGPAELNRLLSWQAGELHFRKQTLGSVVEQFNRYNQRQLQLAAPELAAAEVDGNFKTNDLASFVAAMRTALGVEVEETGEVIRIHAAALAPDSTAAVP